MSWRTLRGFNELSPLRAFDELPLGWQLIESGLNHV
jgi:hypothetical protein